MENGQMFPTMWSKIIQVDRYNVYFIGGTENHVNSSRLTLNLDLRRDVLRERAPMKTGRYAFGLCLLNQHLYVAGGCYNENKYTRKCERYDMIADRWEDLPKLHKFKRYAVSMVAVQRRWLYGVGGVDEQFD
jgi:hypothetical protein